jgi:hypothetical protein
MQNQSVQKFVFFTAKVLPAAHSFAIVAVNERKGAFLTFWATTPIHISHHQQERGK